MSLAANNARDLTAWVGGSLPPDLTQPSFDLSITAFELGTWNKGVRRRLQP